MQQIHKGSNVWWQKNHAPLNLNYFCNHSTSLFNTNHKITSKSAANGAEPKNQNIS